VLTEFQSSPTLLIPFAITDDIAVNTIPRQLKAYFASQDISHAEMLELSQMDAHPEDIIDLHQRRMRQKAEGEYHEYLWK